MITKELHGLWIHTWDFFKIVVVRIVFFSLLKLNQCSYSIQLEDETIINGRTQINCSQVYIYGFDLAFSWPKVMSSTLHSNNIL